MSIGNFYILLLSFTISSASRLLGEIELILFCLTAHASVLNTEGENKGIILCTMKMLCPQAGLIVHTIKEFRSVPTGKNKVPVYRLVEFKNYMEVSFSL